MTTQQTDPLPRRARAFLAAALVAAAGGAASAQDAGEPSPEQLKEKIREIDKLMKQAEAALVESLSPAESARRTEAAIQALLEQKAQQQTGKSAEELRKLAEQGSQEASESLARLTREAGQEVARMSAEGIRKILEQAASQGGAAGEGIRKILEQAQGAGGGASEGLRKILEETKGSSQGVSERIQWVLDNATRHGEQQKPPEKQPQQQKPDHQLEPPKTPEGQSWFVQLPPEVRKSYESGDWDSIPPRWRALIRVWTKKLASDLEKGR